MKRPPLLAIIFLVMLLVRLGPACAAGRAAAAADVEKLQDQVRLLDKDLAVLKEQSAALKEQSAARLDAQDKRQSDIGLAMGQQANYIAYTSIGITLLVFVAGFITYWSAKSRAEKEARDASRTWFDENAVSMRAEIEKLRAQAQTASDQIAADSRKVADETQKTLDHHEASRDRVKVSEETINAFLRIGSTQGDESLPAEERANLEQASQALKFKPEAKFASEEHYLRGMTLYMNGNYPAALESFQAAAERARDPVDAKLVAQYLLAQAVTLAAQRKFDNAIELVDELNERFGGDDTPGVREQLASGLVKKGDWLGAMDKSKEVIPIYDELDRRFGEDDALSAIDKTKQAIAVYGELNDRFGKDTAPAVREQVAGALLKKGNLLRAMNNFQEAIVVYGDLYRSFGNDHTAAVREQAARGLFSKGVALSAMDQTLEAIEVYKELDRHFRDDIMPAVRAVVANGLLKKGHLLGVTGDSKEEIAAYDELKRRFGEDDTPAVRDEVLRAGLYRQSALDLLAQEASKLSSRKDGFGMVEEDARDLFNKGVALVAKGESQEAINTYDELDQRFGNDNTPAVRELIASGLLNKALLLGKLGKGKSPEEIAVYDELERRFGEDDTPAVREKVTTGRANKEFRLSMR